MPSETLDIIFSTLPVIDLKNMRLMNRKMCGPATEHLFRTFALVDDRSLGRLADLLDCPELASRLRHLALLPTFLEPLIGFQPEQVPSNNALIFRLKRLERIIFPVRPTPVKFLELLKVAMLQGSRLVHFGSVQVELRYQGLVVTEMSLSHWGDWDPQRWNESKAINGMNDPASDRAVSLPAPTLRSSPGTMPHKSLDRKL